MEQSEINKDDSYTERRKLFKNIWDTAVSFDDKEVENGKPKVIKTLRLGERDGINIGKTKKQRIKNLRTVCTRLLDYCDRQESEDLMYDQMSGACENSDTSVIFTRKPKKKKLKKKKKKIVQVYSYEPPKARRDSNPVDSFEIEVTDGPVTHRGTRPLRDMFSPRIERANLIQQYLTERTNLENAPSVPVALSSSIEKLQVGDALRKVVKKKRYKKKRSAPAPRARRSPSLPTTSAQIKRVPRRRKKKNVEVTGTFHLAPFKELPGTSKGFAYRGTVVQPRSKIVSNSAR